MLPSNRSLLIIDDDTIVRKSIVAYLEDSSFRVLQADCGQQGLALYAQHLPDVVVTDLRMPGIDGLDVLGKIHEISPDTPVIVMSGVGVIADVVQSLRLGAADFLIKPLGDMEVLVHSINKCLETRELVAENQRYREELEVANSELKEHVQTLEKDQEAGRQVQRRLLPPTPVLRGDYRLEHRVIPSLFLSGDFIDVAYRSERYMSFYLSDVSGHGASSAFTTIWLKHAATEIVNENQLFSRKECIVEDLNHWLTEVNRQLLDTRLGHHMTCLLGVVDLELHLLHYAVAGHLPLPVLVDRSGARFLPGKGRPLGLFPNQQWQAHEVAFPPGATVLAFSDGILEVMPEGDLLEKEQNLLRILASGGSGMAQAFAALGLDAIAESPDDIAILSIERGRQGFDTL
ncbi:MAG: SpoIIE family protein phosphatase [Gammaproteobacteria bacterium]|uniref:fused response regulator/phosphatase n=1 Tax=Pseudomaricurvus alcaniphilus TaxID=1166482 RepID=UPI001407E89E|nr:fused response regulator/phosphatase [Pseudomaricurvus alcaniphilus]MBR9912403.1 SpoIIE family protein phosphatase [Gammaproteobacteria bacterium]NHN36764.1 SpoIIE family protein phosphatase [Pseudomaricurvus alcaniphilus]